MVKKSFPRALNTMGPHGKEVLFALRSAPVGYAAEYLTCGEFPALTMGFSLLIFIRILYHIW